MTTPAQPPQQPPPPPPPPNITGAIADTALAAAVGNALVSSVTTAAAIGVLAQAMKAARIPRQALFAALQIVMDHPPGQTGFYGPATMQTERLNLQRRASFVVAAAHRITSDLAAARSRDQGLMTALSASVTRERRFYAQHLIATWQRSQAGAQTDSAAMTYGRLLGWHAVRDTRTSADCLAANGKNFYADHMPLIGFPGAVHPHCRCQAGASFPGARLLPSYGLPGTGQYRRAA